MKANDICYCFANWKVTIGHTIAVAELLFSCFVCSLEIFLGGRDQLTRATVQRFGNAQDDRQVRHMLSTLDLTHMRTLDACEVGECLLGRDRKSTRLNSSH